MANAPQKLKAEIAAAEESRDAADAEPKTRDGTCSAAGEHRDAAEPS
jgi:hypothetical protein